MIKAPSFFLMAVGAARVIGGPPGSSTPLLLIFHGSAGSKTAFDINATVRARFPRVEQLLVASVVDLRHIPRYMRAAVELTLAAAYRNAAQNIPEHLDPTEYVIILPDWDGKVTSAYDMEQRVNDVGLVIVTDSWTLFDSYNGPEPIVAAEKMVADAKNQSTDTTMKSGAPL